MRTPHGERSAKRRAGTVEPARRRLRPTLMALEDRQLLSTFTVTSTLDDGSDGTLRWAVAPGEFDRGRRHDRLRQHACSARRRRSPWPAPSSS